MIPTNKNNFCFFKNSDIIEAAPIVLVYVISTHTPHVDLVDLLYNDDILQLLI